MKSPSDTPGAETDRTIGELVRVGVIESVDLDAGKAVVRFGEQTTPPIDWLMPVGDTTLWIPPTEGQQVAVIAPEGDADQGFIVGGLPSSAMAPLFLGLKNAIRFKDGAQLSYDPDAGDLDVTAVANIRITGPAGIALDGDVAITGKLDVSDDIHTPGTITGDTDVVAAGKSGKGHKHPAGSPLTGLPQ